MIRSHRFLAWSLILVLLCASFATMQQVPVAFAAANTYYVDTALDGDIAAKPAACPANEANPDANNKDCSLRQAIERANADVGSSEINFIIPADADPDYGYDSGTQTWVIKPDSPLPALSAGDTTITGRNDNTAGTPRIVLDGTNVPPTNGVGITVSSANNIITQLIIINFQGTSNTSGIGIRLTGAGATNNQIYGNYIGNRPKDTSAYANRRAGIQLDGEANTNKIGLGSDPGERNVISGNGVTGSGGDGIVLQGAAGNLIQGNYIGVGLDLNLDPVQLANAGYGIQIADGSGNTIGGSDSTLRNVISGNGLAGVLLTGTGATGNQVIGNYIGTDVFGTSDLGNGEDGVQIAGNAKNNIVSSSPASRSVISGNSGYGVLISDAATTGNQITGVFIGVSVGGGLNLPNDAGGVRIQNNANNNTVGGASTGNVISGNTGYGVSLGRTTVGFTAIISNTISGNIIGLNSAATQLVPNTLGGVLMSSGTKDNRLGGSSAAEQNVISGNGGPGVVISGTATLSNTVAGNLIGLRASSVGGLFTVEGHNSGDGVLVGNGAQYSRIGGTTAEANTIVANTGNGVHVTGADTNNTTIQSNYIGVTFVNNAYIALGNVENGVLVDDAAQRAKILDNHVSGNTLKGIALVPNTPAPGGSPSNANHDIDPPFNIHVNQNGQLTGRVITTGSSDACATPCTAQIFSADPAALDGEGRDLLSQQITSNGYFTATLGGLAAQYALTATDKDGNTSEFFATQLTTIGPIDLQDAAPNVQDAVPGQVVTYTHQLVNNGTVDLLDLKVKALSSRKWTVATVPISGTLFALAAGETKLVTVTLKLPFSPDLRVLAGPPPDQTVVSVRSTKYVTVTDSVTDTTNVLPQFLLDATPLTSSGVGAPDSANSVVRYVHTLRNKGNVTGTVLISAVTDRTWVTTVSTDTMKLAPGEAKNVTISVAIPSGTAANSTPAKTTVTLNVPEAPSQNRTLTDTTAVELTPSALLIHTSEADADAGSGGTASFRYKVQNRSNGPATFSLSGSASFIGTQLTFKRLDGQAFGPGNSFSLDTTAGTDELEFVLEVKLDRNVPIGTVETVTVLLLDAQNRTRAAAQDHITIKGIAFSPFVPRLYLPMVSK